MRDITFFDVNCMVGKWLTPPLTNSNTSELKKNMEYAGIEKAVLYHSDAVMNSISDGNDKISGIISSGNRFEGAWVVVPRCTGEMAEADILMEQMRCCSVRFIKLLPKTHSFDFAQWQLQDLFVKINELKIPILLECSQTTLDKVYNAAYLYPDIPIIITNTSYWPNRGIYELGKKCPNVYFEISTFLNYNGIEDFAEKYGVNRLVFGTNMPFQEPGPAVFRVLYSDLDVAGRQAIASGNLEEIISEIKL